MFIKLIHEHPEVYFLGPCPISRFNGYSRLLGELCEGQETSKPGKNDNQSLEDDVDMEDSDVDESAEEDNITKYLDSDVDRRRNTNLVTRRMVLNEAILTGDHLGLAQAVKTFQRKKRRLPVRKRAFDADTVEKMMFDSIRKGVAKRMKKAQRQSSPEL